MDRSSAIGTMPEARAVVLCLEEDEFGEAAIGRALVVYALQPLPVVEVAGAELARLLAKEDEMIELTNSDCGALTRQLRKGSK